MSTGTAASFFRPSKAARITALYLVFAALWIFFSDRLLTLTLDDPELLIKIGMAKGFAFVAVTALMLYLLLRFRGDGDVQDAAPPAAPQRRKLAGVVFGMLLVVPLLAFSIVRLHTPHVKEDTFSNLRAVASLKASQVEHWLDERQSDAEALAASEMFALQAEKAALFDDAAASAYVAKRLEGYIHTYRKAQGFDSAMLVDASGRVLVSAGMPHQPPPTLEILRMLPVALTSGLVQRSDLFRDASGQVHLDYIVPLTVNAGDSRRISALAVLHAPIKRFLFPLIQTWPTPSPSAESLLVRRDGDRILYLNELRHRHDAALTLSLPLENPRIPAVAAAIGGKALIIEGVDYRGMAVYAATQPVAGTSWHLVAKIDSEEVMAPLNLLIFWVSLVALVAVAVISATMLLLWRQTLRAHCLELDAQAAEIRHKGEAGYRRLIESMRDAFAMVDMSGRLTDFNQPFQEMLGYSDEELRSLTYVDLTPGKWHEGEYRIINEQVVVHGQSSVYEKEYIRKDGTIFPVELKTFLICDENAQPEAMWAIVRDITERKRADDTLRLHGEILRNLSEGIFLIRTDDGKIVFTNPRAEDLLGYAAGELIGKPVTTINASGGSSPEAVAASIIAELARSGAWSGEVLNIRKDGSTLWCHASVSTFEHPQFGKLWVSVHEDITERKQAEEALARSEEEFRTLAEAMPQIVWMTRPDGWGIYSNRRWVDYTGMTQEESHGHGWSVPFHPDDRQRARDAWQYATATGGRYEIECRLRRADGVYRWWLIRGVPLKDADGHVLKWLGACTDIDGLKQAEAEITRLNVNLEQKVEERTAQLKAINKELETFTYSVSHDLKAPLRGIDGYSQLLQIDHAASLNAEGKIFVANIRKGAQQMAQLIEDLLAYSRLERCLLQTARIDAREVAETVLATFADEIQARQIAVNVKLPALEISADVDGLAMILRNLLDNALKFTRDAPSPAIEIGGREEAETCILWVRDNGIGFDMKHRERIFEIFQRLHRAEDYPGTGVGLAIARKAAQRMGARVWAESAPGEGAAFYVEVPK